jgi:hypothetical protein
VYDYITVLLVSASTLTKAPGLSATSNEAAGTYGSSGVDAVVVDDATLCERLRALLRPLLSAAFCSNCNDTQTVQFSSTQQACKTAVKYWETSVNIS